jgi:hypothetical protein
LPFQLAAMALNRAADPSLGLCEYCSQIDFEMLRHPTVADIRLLNAGGEPKDQYPYKYDESEQITRNTSLGLHSRIQLSSANCSLCSAVVEIHRRHPDILDSLRAAGVVDPLCIAVTRWAGVLLAPDGTTWKMPRDGTDCFYLRQLSLDFRPLKEGETAQPGILSPDLAWRRLYDCFQTYQPDVGTAQGGVSKTPEIWQTAGEPESILFGARKRPPMLDPKLLKSWLEHCLANHGDTCGSMAGSNPALAGDTS